MVKAKRVKGERIAPDLPTLQEDDFKPHIWEGVKKASWSLEETACYLHEVSPQNFKPDLEASDPVNRTYAWLFKEFKNNRLMSPYNNERFSPGSVMRYMWENHRHFPLTVWALYDLATSIQNNNVLHTKIFKGNYITASKVIWNKYPNITKDKMVGFLLSIAGTENRESGLPFFFCTSRETLLKTLQGKAPLGKGAPKKDTTIDPRSEKHKEDVLKLLRKEIG